MFSSANAGKVKARAAPSLWRLAAIVCAATIAAPVPTALTQDLYSVSAADGENPPGNGLTIDAPLDFNFDFDAELESSVNGFSSGKVDPSFIAANSPPIGPANTAVDPPPSKPPENSMTGVVTMVEPGSEPPSEDALAQVTTQPPAEKPVLRPEVLTATPPTTTNPLPPQLAKATVGKMVYSFKAEKLEIKQALALFARANNLNIVPDPDITGEITVDLKDLPLDTMMEAFLGAHGFHWEEMNGLFRVHSSETRIFTIDYPRLVRTGDGYSAASLGGAGGGGGGSGGSSGGSSGGGGAGGGGTNITQADNIDFWTELETQLKVIASPDAKVMLDRMSGVVQVTDRPYVLNNIEDFLERMRERVKRQVDIQAKIYEVVLNKELNLGIDWSALINNPNLGIVLDTSAIVKTPIGGIAPGFPALGAQIMYKSGNDSITSIIEALEEQGNVNAVSQPRIRSLNNQMAVIKVGTEQPFFNTSSGFVAGEAGVPGGTFENTSFEMITVGTILSLTPQIADDGMITLDVSPVITSLVSIESAGGANTNTAPVLDVKQSSSLIRIQSGQTIVIGGLIQDKNTRTDRRVPFLGNVPVIGKAFRGTARASQKSELIIFLTPTIVEDGQ